MHLRKTEAIVISSTDYGESDRIVTFYTKDFGRIKGIAKGAKRSKRRFPNTLEPFSHIKTEITQKEHTSLYWINECSLIEGFFEIQREIERFIYGSIFLEMVERLTGEGHPIPDLFALFIIYLKGLNSTRRPEILTPLFALRLLSILGLGPYVFGCVICERPIIQKSNLLFSHKEGGLICPYCENVPEGSNQRNEKPEGLNLSLGTVKTLKYALTAPLEGLGRLNLSLGQQRESLKVLKGFIGYHLDKELKSLSLLKQLKIDD